MEKVQRKSTATNAYEIDRQLEMAMDAMRLRHRMRPVEQLSGGERRRVALCKTLLQRQRPAAARRADQPPRRESVEWLEHHLAGYPRAVVAVTHDRYFLDNVAQWILELDERPRIPVLGQLLRLA